MEEWPDGPLLFERLRDLRTPLRMADLADYVPFAWLFPALHPVDDLSGGLDAPSGHAGGQLLPRQEGRRTGVHGRGRRGPRAVRVAGGGGDRQRPHVPRRAAHARGSRGADRHLAGRRRGIRCQNRQSGVIQSGGGAAEDEEVLVLFASQAAAAIVNARTYRAEQRTRADLEALIDTSPVGVVVFDARTGIVEGLMMPDRCVEKLLEVVTYRRDDGREIALGEFALARELRNGETVRAEEIVLTVPDGRSVTTLVNATPIQSADGGIVSVVVTMQDLAPLQELERLRSEFLGMVSHELRAPLTSIKGSTATVLDATPDLDPAEMLQFFRINRRAGRSHARPDRRPARRGAHRHGYALGLPRGRGGGRAGGPGPDHVPEWQGQPAPRPHRPSGGAAAGDGRPAAHRPGPE